VSKLEEKNVKNTPKTPNAEIGTVIGHGVRNYMMPELFVYR